MSRGRLAFPGWVAVLLLGAGCGGEPTAPGLPELEVVALAGQGEFVVVGQELRLEAVVRRRSDGEPRSGVEVVWTVERGDAALLPGTGAGAVSDEAGLVWTRVRLGETPGGVEVRVTVRGQDGAGVLFTATVGAHPRLDGVSPAMVAAGATMALEGSGFSVVPEEDVVLFSGIRARVTSATAERLEVVVPPCLPTREVQVTVQLGTLVSQAVPVRVEAAGEEELELAPGSWVDFDDPAAPGCLRLPGDGRYLVLGSSSSTVAGARYPVTLRGLSSSSPVAESLTALEDPRLPGPEGSFAARWEASHRAREDALARRLAGGAARREGPEASGPPLPRSMAPAPPVGHRRSFQVLNADGELEEVTAVAREVGGRAAIYVDETAPEGGFDDADLGLLSRRFDQAIHPTVTGAFGDASDLDGNQRVIILFTPVVNRLTPRGGDGFVGGFFFGLDLLEGQGGNDGEIFYALVPDPEGLHSDPRSVERVVEAVPAVLAHELQHMVHFNQRVLLRGGVGTGALWLSEGLAQMAEELVARRYEEGGEGEVAESFRSGNRRRARLYLADPAEVSLVVATGQGTLAERGGGWLFTLYLEDRWGPGILAELTATTRSGVENVTFATGADWPGLLADWWSALWLAGGDGGRGYGFAYPTVGLRALLATPGEEWPLEPARVGTGDVTRADTLWSASTRHYIVEPSGGAALVLRLAGGSGAVAPSGSELGLRVVRLF